MYDYRKAITEDIREYLEENYIADYLEEVDFEVDSFDFDDIYNQLWIADSVTGNASGSYTFNRLRAEQYVKGNLPLCIDAMEEFGCSAEEFGKKVYNEEWEYLDVTIRCYLLSECLNEVLEEMGEEV